MLSDDQLQRVWEGKFYGEVRAVYFGDLANRFHWRQRAISAAMLFLSSGAVVSLAGRLDPVLAPWLPIALTLATAALSALNFTAQFTKTAIEAADLQHRWATIANSWQELWDQSHEPDAADRLLELERKAADIGRAGVALPYYPKRMAAWQRHIETLYSPRVAVPSH